MKKVKFGVIADLHVDIQPDAKERLFDFLEAAKREDVDFIIELGDFCYPELSKMQISEKNERRLRSGALNLYADKRAIIDAYNNFGKPAYHVIGNHDCDVSTRDEYMKFVGMEKLGPYYSFDVGGFHFVVLDANYVRYEGRYIPFAEMDYQKQYKNTDERTLPFISPDQLAWLEYDLWHTEYPTVLFSHQRLVDENEYTLVNHEELGKILRSAPNGVVLSLNGHEHIDTILRKDNVWYYNVNSISNYWLSPDDVMFTEERYSPEIHKRYPYLKCTAPYEDALYAFVTLDERGATIKGRQSKFIGSTPDDMKVYDYPYYKKNVYDLGFRITPSVEDRYLPFD